jgi:glycosyltransferase involved in cell wall biosynthesis
MYFPERRNLMRILVIIPAYNEAANIVRVIASVRAEYPAADILVVNDGSLDQTGQQAEKTGQAKVINLPCNLGIGGAVQTGFKFARLGEYDVALQFDGDGQHLASEISSLLAPIESGQADVVIGSRFHSDSRGFKSTPIRRIGIKIFSLLNSLLIRQKITDNTSGFRAYNKKALQFLAEYYPSEYPEPEAVILLGKNGFRMREIPVHMLERQGGQSSIRGVLAVYYMLKVLLGIFMGAVRAKIGRD